MFNHVYLQCRKRNININLNCKYTNYILDHTRVETAHMHNTSSHLALHGMWIHVRVQMQIHTLCATFATHRRTQRIHARSWKKTMQKETERHHHIAIQCHTRYIILPAASTLSPESSFEEFDYSLSPSRAPSDSVLWLLYWCITSTLYNISPKKNMWHMLTYPSYKARSIDSQLIYIYIINISYT